MKSISANLPVILVVEDEPLLRMHAAEIFEDAGFATLEAGSADDAVEFLQNRNDIRVVFTDIEMPGTMDGLKFALLVRDRWPPVAIVLTSGKVDVRDVELPSGSIFVSKPYDQKFLVEKIQELMP